MTCELCARRPAVCTPVIVVPIIVRQGTVVRTWPFPTYLQFKGPICLPCAAAFNLNKFTDYVGAWYDLAGDSLRSYRQLSANPYPDDPEFKWEAFVLDPKYEPGPREECFVQFWKLETLEAKGMHVRLH